VARSDNNNHQSRKAAPDATRPRHANLTERQHLDELLDEGLKETFPASDPVAIAQQPPERPKSGRRRAQRSRSADADDRGPQDKDLP